MKILDRLIDGLCDLEKAAREDDFFKAWLPKCREKFKLAKEVAARLKAGAHPHPMGIIAVAIPDLANVKSAYERGRHEIEQFWVLYLALVVSEIDRVTGATLQQFKEHLLSSSIAHAVFPPGAKLGAARSTAHTPTEKKHEQAELLARHLAYIDHLRNVVSQVDKTERLGRLIPPNPDLVQPHVDGNFVGASALSAAITCRLIGYLARSEPSGAADRVVERFLSSSAMASESGFSAATRGQVVFPTGSSSAFRDLFVEFVSDPRCVKLVMQRPDHWEDLHSQEWAACRLQPGRYGDIENGTAARQEVLAPGRGMHFHLAVFCTVIEQELRKYPDRAHGVPYGNTVLGRYDPMNTEQMRKDQISLLESLRQPSQRKAVSGATEKDKARASWLDGLLQNARFAPSNQAAADHAQADMENMGLEFIELPFDWSTTRDAYAATVRLDWERLDPSGGAQYLDLLVIGRRAETYEVVPFELEQLNERDSELLIQSRFFGSLKPIEIRQVFESGAWGADVAGDTLFLCVVLRLPVTDSIAAQ